MAREIIGSGAEKVRDIAGSAASAVAATAHETASTVLGVGEKLLRNLPLSHKDAYLDALQGQFDQTASAIDLLPKRNHMAGVTPWTVIPPKGLGFEIHTLTDEDSTVFPIHRMRLGVQAVKTVSDSSFGRGPDTILIADHVAGLPGTTDEGVRDKEIAIRDTQSYWLGSLTLRRSELSTLEPEDAVSRLVTLNGLLVVYNLSQQHVPDIDDQLRIGRS